jgi:O-succinylbenzoic acid--CoA ligase
MLSVPNPIVSTALARAEHPILVGDGESLTARELRQRVAARATALGAQGFDERSVIALWGPPSVEWVISYHAIGWLGATAAPLPANAADAELEALIAALAPDALLMPADTLSRLGNGAAHLPLTLQPDPTAPLLPERFWPLEEVRAVVFTSGTTGGPKHVSLTTAQLLFSAFGSAIRLGHDLHDRWLACLPLHHIGGLSILTRCAMMGTCVVLHRAFDAERVARDLDSGQVTMVSLVPTMLERVLDARPASPFPSSLRTILVGGAPLPSTTLERCRAIGAPLSITWGMTETASQVATRLCGDLAPDGSSGSPLPFVRVRDEQGRLRVRGPLVRNGDLVTQDLGHVDRSGRVHVRERIDDVIISGGEKVCPSEVERILVDHPSVAECAVVGRADEDWGERPVAFVVPTAAPADDLELVRWCRDRLTPFKVPDRFVWCDALPRSATGKVQRHTLRERASSATEAEELADARPRGLGNADTALLKRLALSGEEPRLDQLADQLRELHRWLSNDIGEVEQAIVQLSEADQDLAQRTAAHLLARPGKRIRPLCVLLAARLESEQPAPDMTARLVQLAVACELVHAATLLHDDVIDGGTERRGAAAARTLFGNTASILAGDHLLTDALKRVSLHGTPALLESLLETISQMIAAEALQLEQQRRFDPRPELYRRIVDGKTAALFRWGMRAGATLSELPAAAVTQADVFGQELGFCFQLVDDLLDFTGDPEQVGKNKLADLREGKLTWPLLLAARRDGELAADLRELTRRDNDQLADPAVASKVVQRVQQTGALAATRGAAREHARRAREALDQLPRGTAHRALGAVIAYCVARVS